MVNEIKLRLAPTQLSTVTINRAIDEMLSDGYLRVDPKDPLVLQYQY
jgi:hypothetical protein